MDRQEIFNLTTPSKEMPLSTFDRLMENRKMSRNTDTDISFEAKYNNYEVLFGMEDNQMYVEHFGFNKNGWIELEPNQWQLDIMLQLLQNIPAPDIEYLNNRYIDHYDEDGVKRENFY